MGSTTVTNTFPEQNNREDYRAGKANWDAFILPMDTVHEAATEWKQTLHGVSKPWLCWNVDNDWCLVQQKLVLDMGWTPIVGYDPRAGAPELVNGSILVDFNKHFGFPALHMVFPLEFVFLYTDRLAFWHSDLLVRTEPLAVLAKQFFELKDGETAAVDCRGGFLQRLSGRKGRYWELIGATTKEASRNQFEKGAGWWRHIEKHPQCPSGSIERNRRLRYPYDHGAGILYWKNQYGGKVLSIRESLVAEGHCTGIGRLDYSRVSPQDERRDLTRELSLNYDLQDVCTRLGLQKYLY